MDLLEVHNLSFYFYPIQGYLIQSLLIFGYVHVDRKLTVYNKGLIAKYGESLRQKNIDEMQSQIKETRKFSTYICQFMLVYMLYATLKMALIDVASYQRICDVADICLTFSYLLMLFGVSDMIQRAVERETMEERVR